MTPPFPEALVLDRRNEHIEQVVLHDVKSIRRFRFKTSGRLTLLVGDNQSGKTSVLQGIACALSVIDKDTELNGIFFEQPLHPNISGRRTDFDTFEPRSRLHLVDGRQLVGPVEATIHSSASHASIPKLFFVAERTMDSLVENFREWFTERDTAEAKQMRATRNLDYRHPELEAVRSVVRALVPGARDFRTFGEKATIVLEVHGQEDEPTFFGLDELSGGVRTFLSMVVSIARALIDANPKVGIDGTAIVLIDEIDLHLHPKWQLSVVPALVKVFPGTQFFITTHSEQVISSVPSECVIALSRGPEGVVARALSSVEGATADRVLEDVMGVPRRPETMQRMLDAYIALVDDGLGESEEALALRKWLDARLGNLDPDLVVADLEIRRLRAARQRVTP